MVVNRADPRDHERRCRPGAEAGDPAAMTGLGWALAEQGRDADAELWYARAADAGQPAAMDGLAVVLDRRGDRTAALGWWRTAAAAGEANAMRNLAAVLRRASPAEAQRWEWFADAAGNDPAAEDVPEEVARAAAGLGALRSVAGNTDSGSTVGALVLGAVIGLAVAAAGLVPVLLGLLVWPSWWPVGCVVLAGLVVLGTAGLVWNGRRTVPVRVWRFEHGLVHRDVRGDLDVLPWADVRVLRTIVVRSSNGRYTGTDFRYVLLHRDGHRRALHSGLVLPRGQMCVLGHAIEQGVAAVRLPRALDALRAGGRLDFGPLAVDPDGIADGPDHLPWHRVGSVAATDGKLRITADGARTAWSSTPIGDVPDIGVFLTLVEALRRAAGTTR